MSNLSFYLNISGLGLNIIGVVILFFTGLPAEAYEKAQYVETAETSELKRVRCFSKIALVLLVMGSLLQIAAAVTSHVGNASTQPSLPAHE